MPPTLHAAGAPATAETYAELQALYARQAWQLDGAEADAFVATFTEDASFAHVSSGEVLEGRAAIAAALGRTATARQGAVYRHWFSQLRVETTVDPGTVRAWYYAIVSVTDAAGAVTWDPSCVVEDVLVRRDGEWLTSHRIVRRDDLLLR
ncbi:nuclear transport factor 2 family protein [Streptacidiphilus sp. N1-10]|uniref:Nuclear transport factor 2 family protein n=1 Tax=Streptacidiphilus jeojiensis TaxID=3229225 RepID=A0ABV6XHA7_9ACTN